MPSLLYLLKSADTGFLQIISSKWDLELPSEKLGTWPELIFDRMTRRGAMDEFLARLPLEAQAAFKDLVDHKGRIPWSEFIRSHGDLREMGAGRRDREHPELSPQSAAEILWYAGVMGKGFLESSSGLIEYAYLPDEIKPEVSESEKKTIPLGRPFEAESIEFTRSSGTAILDDACTLLAALRIGMPLDNTETGLCRDNARFLVELLKECKIVNKENSPQPDSVRQFLESPDQKALANLLNAWKQSTGINELRLISDLEFEGTWKNDSLRTRKSFLGLIKFLPENTWWDFASFIAAIHSRHPDFQRSAGDYDSWFIRRVTDGKYLKGFAAWFDVEGRLIRYFIEGPLHWLGLVDLAFESKNDTACAFRKTAGFDDRLAGKNPVQIPIPEAKIKPSSSGQIVIPRDAPRAVRYQVARFCDWGGSTGISYSYHVTAASLARASSQGLKVQQLIALLKANSSSTVPPSLIKSLERWEKFGIQAHIEHPTLLRLSQAEILVELQQSRAGKFLGEVINPTTVVVKPGREKQVLSALAELGWVGEIQRGV